MIITVGEDEAAEGFRCLLYTGNGFLKGFSLSGVCKASTLDRGNVVGVLNCNGDRNVGMTGDGGIVARRFDNELWNIPALRLLEVWKALMPHRNGNERRCEPANIDGKNQNKYQY